SSEKLLEYLLHLGRLTTGFVCVFVDKHEHRFSLMDQRVLAIIDIVFKFDSHSRFLAQSCDNPQKVIILGRRKKTRSVLAHWHHYTHLVELAISPTGLTQTVRAGNFVLHGVVAVVGISHLVGFAVSDSDGSLRNIHY